MKMGERQSNREPLIEALFAVLLALLFAYAIFAGTYWPYKAALFPTIVGIPGVVLALAVALLAMRRIRQPRSHNSAQSQTPGDLTLDESLLTAAALKRTAVIFGWIFGAIIGSWLVGQKLALPLFVFAYLKFGSREGWLLSLAMTLATVALLLGVFDYVVNVAWHDGELFHWLGIQPL